MFAHWGSVGFAAAVTLVFADPAFAQGATSVAFVNAINDERALRGLAPIVLSDALARLAQDRAMEIGASDALDFEPLSGDEELAEATAYGYPAWLAQELAAVNDADPCDIVRSWTESLPPSEVYLRHEAKQIGVGVGMVGFTPLYVLLVGVPSAEADPLRKRFPGVAPREWLTARLVAEANKYRLSAAHPAFYRSPQLDGEAQKMAEQLLACEELDGAGLQRLPDGTPVLYFKGRGHWRIAHPEPAVKIWFEQDRAVALVAGQPVAGAGLASRGADDGLEAVWTLAVADAAAEARQ